MARTARPPYKRRSKLFDSSRRSPMLNRKTPQRLKTFLTTGSMLLTGSILLPALWTGGILDRAWAASQNPGSRACGLYVGAQSLRIADMSLADTGDVMLAGGQGADLHEVDVPGLVSASVLTASAAAESGVASSETS